MSEDVREIYADVARDATENASCCEPHDPYTPEQRRAIPAEAELGLGTGDPVGVANPRLGETVLDLGSGSGVDVFLAAQAVGPEGEAIGVDLTPEMVGRARRLAEEHGFANTEFLEAPIEDVPLPDGVADVVVSNCVINLSEDKPATLAEAFRLLAPGGRLVVSDTLRLSGQGDAPGCACTQGALTPIGWETMLERAGFEDVDVEAEPPDGRFGPDVGTGLIRALKPA